MKYNLANKQNILFTITILLLFFIFLEVKDIESNTRDIKNSLLFDRGTNISNIDSGLKQTASDTKALNAKVLTAKKEALNSDNKEVENSTVALASDEQMVRKEVTITAEEEKLNGILQARINELKNQKQNEPLIAGVTPMAEAVPSVNEVAVDKSCYVTIGNYSQPKFAFNSDCEPLPKEMEEKKISLTLGKLPESFTANFKSKNEKSVIYVFTDYTCPFCKKLHNNIDDFNKAGITVKYLQYPRIVNSNATDEAKDAVMTNMRNAWCANDHTESFDYLFRNKNAKPATCDINLGRINPPMREHFALARQLDLEYTPTIVSQDGKVSYGFSSVQRTLSELGVK